MRSFVARTPFIFLCAAAWFACSCGDDTDGEASNPHDASVSDSGEPERNPRLLAVSATHGCALREAGLFCWGRNFEGQLGNGNVEDTEEAVKADVDVADIVELVARSGRTCLRRRSGEVACWGANADGQIGDGTRDRALQLTAALDIDDARQLVIDDFSTCVLRADESVACWGRSPESSPDAGSSSPRTMEGLEGAVELRSGAFDTYCARGEEGWVRCVRFKDGAWTEAAPVEPLFGATAIAVTFQDEVCAIMPSTEILCSNLDSGNTVPLENSSGSVALQASGGLYTCAKDMDDQWSCWNVLPSMLESVGSPKLPAPTDMKLLDLAVSGFNVCGWREDDSIACVDANDASLSLRVVEGLPR